MADSTSNFGLRDLPPYCVVESIERYGARLDGRRFSAMRLGGDGKEIRDVCTGCMSDTAVVAWIKRWWYWAGRCTKD